jgi:predicted ATPase/serine/threonine protein kinase
VLFGLNTAMDWKRVRELFERALDREPGARSAFLDEACEGDAGVRQEVEALLAAHERPGGFLTNPARFARVTNDLDGPVAAVDRVGIGTIVGDKYRIDSLLGSGGMGAVYRATSIRLERPVALKVIRHDLLSDPSTVERFRREAVTVARLRHPHIITIHDYGIADGIGAYLVMELLEGRSLREELARRKRLDVPTVLALLDQVCSAVATAHQAGVVHRDLKPENIFLEMEAREQASPATAVKVLDFGLAKLETAYLKSREALTARGVLMGTPAYMSPEQCIGEEADARSDVYALGCVAFEALTGKPPFEGKTMVELVYRHVNDPPRRPSDLAPEIDPALDEAILRALAKMPEERQQTALAFAQALAGVDGLDTAEPGGTTREGGEATGSIHGAPIEKQPPTNLVRPITRFVGRERQIDEVRARLGQQRLVTLAGPGGIGKSRLALEVAARAIAEFEDGVWLVELAALSDPALVVRAVASAVGAREPNTTREIDALAAWLRDRRTLIVLDNCEHLVDACAQLAERVLTAAPGVRVLATSREALGIAGEVVWPVPPLEMPKAGAEERAEAVNLFADRATLARPAFELTPAAESVVAELCRRLEGIPLAIELAAARVRALTIEQILARLDDRFRLLSGGSRTAPSRQQTLRATIDWSYELLTEEERGLLRLLSVFSGGWTLDDAESVVGKDEGRRKKDESEGSSLHPQSRSAFSLSPSEVLHHLERLVDKSLVFMHDRGRETRYGMLEVVRDYAFECLRESREEAWAARSHASVFLALAEAAVPEFTGPNAAAWLARLEYEHDNFRAALEWLLENDPSDCLRLATLLRRFWFQHGHFAEGREWLKGALERNPTATVAMRMMALHSSGEMAHAQGDLAAARALLEQNVQAPGSPEVAQQIAWSTFVLGLVVFAEGDVPAARTYLEAALARARELDDERLVGNTLNALGEVYRHEGDWPAARKCFDQSLEICRRRGHQAGIGVVLCNIAAAHFEEGDLESARSSCREGLTHLRALGNPPDVALALDVAGAVAAKEGRLERAARLAGAADTLRAAVGFTLEVTDAAFRDRYVAMLLAQHSDVAVAAAMAEGHAMTSEQAVEYALSP